VSRAVELGLLLGAVVVLVSVVAVRFSTRLGLPSLLVYLALGMLLGESGLGIRFDDADLTRTLGTIGLVLIIAEGGLTARWSALKPVLGVSAMLATVGVAVSVVVVGVVTHLLLGMDLRLALLAGAVLSSTDAAAVFSTLRRLRLRPRMVAILEAESGINDAPAALLVVLLAEATLAAGKAKPWWEDALVIGYELAAGVLIGLAVGFAGRWVLRRVALPAAGLYPLAAVAFTILAYASGAVLHASGFIAVYVAGVLLGNARLPHRQAILGFADGIAWLAQIGLFVLLGLLASPSRLPGVILPAIVIGATLLFLARPVSVAASVLPFAGGRTRMGLREQAFLSWAGLRGAVPIVFATIPLSMDVPGAERLFDAVFVLVVIFTLVQASTLPPVAHVLGVTAAAEPAELRVETAPLERMRADLLQLDVPEESSLVGVHLDELRLPSGAVVTMVQRGESGFVPTPSTRLKGGDSLLIVASDEVRDATVRRLRAVSRRGRLARWFGENGADATD